MQAGKLCRTCAGGTCRELVEAWESRDVECPSCGGLGCRECDARGTFAISGCPQQQFVDRDMTTLARFAELFFAGIPPVAGGAFDQESWFLEAAMALRREQCRAEFG